MPQTTADPAFDFAHGRLFGDDNQKGRVTATAGKVRVWKVRTVAVRGTLRTLPFRQAQGQDDSFKRKGIGYDALGRRPPAALEDAG